MIEVCVWRIDSFFIQNVLLLANERNSIALEQEAVQNKKERYSMKKGLLRKLLLLMSTSMLLVACGTDTTEEPAQTEDAETTNVEEVPESEEAAEGTTEGSETNSEEVTANFDIVIDGEAVADLSREVTVSEGTYLLDAMHTTYDIEEEGGFIAAIEGYEQDEDAGRYWLYYINGEMPSVGAAEYELQEGDQIEWRLEDSE